MRKWDNWLKYMFVRTGQNTPDARAHSFCDTAPGDCKPYEGVPGDARNDISARFAQGDARLLAAHRVRRCFTTKARTT